MISFWDFRQRYTEENERTKVRKLLEAVPKLEEPCGDLKGLIETVSGLYNCTGLNIAHDSMSHRTAKAVYEKLSGGFIFIQEYFSYIEHNHFCEKVTTCSTDKLVERFFGIATDRSPGSNPNFIEFAQILTCDAFLFNVTHIFQPDSWTFLTKNKR